MPGSIRSRMTRSAGALPQPRQHLASRGDAIDAVAGLLQVVRDERGDIGVVFDDQNL